ncbi:hypothetical protein HMI55_003353 [Coelomomyces lativittatus]|nr:hypothetical protein HMI55_003353 [Coelomomyces lativittatus]
MNPSISTTSSNTFQMSASVDTKWSLNQIHTNTHTLFSATSFQSKNLVNLKQKNSNSTKLLNSSDPAAFDTSRPTILLNPNRKQTKSRLFFPISNGNQDPQSSILTSYSSNLNANMSSPSSMKEAGSSKMQQTTEENTAFLERNEMKIGTSNKSISSLTAMDSISTPTTSHLPYSSLTSKFFHWVSEHQGTSDLPPFVQDDPIWNEAFQSTLKQIKSQPTSKHYYQRLFKCIFLLYLKKFLPKTSSHSNSTMSSIQVSSFDPVAVLDQLIQWYEQSHDLIATLMDAPDGYLMLSDMTKALAPVHRNHAKHFLELAHTHSKTAFMLDPGRGHASAQLGWILLAKKDIPMALYFLLRASCSVQPASTIEVLHSYFRRILSPITNETSTSLPSASLALSKLLGHLYTKTSLDETPSLMRALQTPFPLSYSFIAIFLETLLRSHPHAHGFAMNFFWHCLWTYARAHAFLPLCAMSWHLHHLPFTYHDVPAQDQPLAISAFVQLCDYLNTMPQASLHDEEQEEDEDDIVEEEEEEEEDDLEGKDDRDPRHRLRPPPLKRKRNHLRSSPSPVDLDLDLDLDLTSRRVIPLTSSSSSSLRSPTSTSTSPQPTHHNVYTLPKPFKHPHFQGVKRKIRSLKQITSALASVPITDFPTCM